MNVAEMKTRHADEDIACRIDYVPTLVVALHPQLERVGEVAPLLELVNGERAYISRNRPDFSKDGSAGKPLNNSFISRSPVIIQRDTDDIYRVRAHSTSTQVSIDGRALQREYLLSQSELAGGVIISLNQKIVLVLKLLPLQDKLTSKHNLLKGISPDIHALNDKLQHIAGMDIPVIIRGAAGAGKELAAMKLHQDSGRAEQPFMVINLAAIHDAVAEEELFGVKRDGQLIAGYFSQVGKGCLVLEDLEDASEKVIGLLFAAIKRGDFVAVNDTQTQPINCRIIMTSIYETCPCSRESRLWQLTNLLAAYQVFLPSLAERIEDIGILFLYFVRQQWQKLYPESSFSLAISVETMVQVLSFNWPGNVRQLRNVARQVVIDSRNQDSLQLDPQLLSILKPQVETAHNGHYKKNNGKGRRPNTVGREELLNTLRQNQFELQATAQALAISRASVYQLIQRFDGINTAQDLTESELSSNYQKWQGDTEKMMWDLEVSQVGLRRRLKAMGFDI